MKDKIGIVHSVALKMYYDAGFNSELFLKLANESLKLLKQPIEGYFYADEVSDAIEFDKKLLGII